MASPPNISTVSAQAIGISSFRSAGGATTGYASVAWLAANFITVIPFRLDFPFVVRRLFWYNGATVGTDGASVGVYDETATKLLVTCANTTTSGTNAIQSVAATTTTPLFPGNYYLAFGASGTTTTVFMTASNTLPRIQALGCLEQQSGYSSGLPTAPTFVAPALAGFLRIPLYGISQGSVI